MSVWFQAATGAGPIAMAGVPRAGATGVRLLKMPWMMAPWVRNPVIGSPLIARFQVSVVPTGTSCVCTTVSL